MRILTVHNPDDERLLRTKVPAFDFTAISKAALRELIADMRKTMERAPGVGLSGNQLGLPYRFFVARDDGKFYAFFNPEIEKSSWETGELEEGCLSLPGVHVAVRRPEAITLRAFDRNGKRVRLRAWGLLARIFQHEIDHLNGVLITDYR